MSLFTAINPRTSQALDPEFQDATAQEIDRAVNLGAEAADVLRNLPAEEIAKFLMSMREEILATGDALLEKADQETALGIERLRGERDRTTNQLKMFADLVTEGSWVDARIETALPDRKPLPKPDLRRMMIPIGPVAVFGASNFPLAYSVAGGDTASAYAAGNPVIVKAHPAHPGTSEIVAEAIVRAVKSNGLPEGTFGMIHGKTPEVSIALVTHPKLKAVGFTGSLRAGRALFDAASKRPEPIPVYAEMGSVNPVFVLPGAMDANPEGIADGLFRSVTLGVGQFCTSPGLVFAVDGDSMNSFQKKLIESFEQGAPATMLNGPIAKGYGEKFQEFANVSGVKAFPAKKAPSAEQTEGAPGVFVVQGETWAQNDKLREEIFGPATVIVHCGSRDELLKAAHELDGTLTATIHGNEEDLRNHRELIDVLRTKAGRLIFNGYPTGVEVCQAMNHGGPYPASSDAKFTSVGATAIYRFVRPVCYQNFPQSTLPPELRDENPRKIWRNINGQLTRDAVR